MREFYCERYYYVESDDDGDDGEEKGHTEVTESTFSWDFISINYYSNT